MRLRPLTEAECYARCYGARADESVRLVSLEPRSPRYDVHASGEDLLRRFEELFEARDEGEEAA